MKETMPGAAKAHAVTVDKRAQAVVTGVEDVELFSGEKISALTSAGAIIITGSGLKAETLNLDDGRLVLSGKIDAIAYDERAPRAKSVLGRIFR